MEELRFTIKSRKSKREQAKDKVVKVSAEVYEALQFFSSETGYPIKMLTDALLRFGLDNVRVIYDDDEGEVG